jgi:hypothetical protein
MREVSNFCTLYFILEYSRGGNYVLIANLGTHKRLKRCEHKYMLYLFCSYHRKTREVRTSFF